MITATLHPNKYSPHTSYWTAQCQVNGRSYVARSRSGAANELARALVAAGIDDDELQTVLPDDWNNQLMGWGRPGKLLVHFKSFHAAAQYTYNGAGDRVRYVPPNAIPDCEDRADA
jgi:hypothetical protein